MRSGGYYFLDSGLPFRLVPSAIAFMKKEVQRVVSYSEVVNAQDVEVSKGVEGVRSRSGVDHQSVRNSSVTLGVRQRESWLAQTLVDAGLTLPGHSAFNHTRTEFYPSSLRWPMGLIRFDL